MARTLISKPESRTAYSENYYRVLLALFGLAYLFSYYYRGPAATPVKEFIISRGIFGWLPLVLTGLTYLIGPVRKHIKDIGSAFFLLCTLHLIGFFAINGFLSYYETGIITAVLISNLHLNKVLYIVLYNVIILTAMEYVFITAPANSTGQPVIFFFFLLSVMVICVFYQLYRIREQDAASVQERITEGLISGNPDAWMILEGPGLVAAEASPKAFNLFGIKETGELSHISLRTLIAGHTQQQTEQVIRSILDNPVSEYRGPCRKQDGTLFQADVSCFHIPGQTQYIQCRFVEMSGLPTITTQVTDDAIRYRRYLDQVDAGIMVCDDLGQIKLTNKAAYTLLDLDPDISFMGRNLSEALPGTLATNILQAFSTEQGTEPAAFSWYEQEKNLDVTCREFYDYLDNRHEIVLHISRHVSIVAGRAPEISVPERPSKDASLLYPVPEPVAYASLGSEPAFLQTSEGLCRLLEYTNAELLSIPASQLIHPLDLETWKEHLHSLQVAEVRMKTRSGRTLTVRLFTARSAPNGILHILFSDISGFRRTEDALAEAGARVRAIIENSDDPIFSVDFNHRITGMNSAFISEFTRRDQAKKPGAGDDIREFFTKSEKEGWEQVYKQVMKGQGIRRDEQYRYKDGTVKHFEISYRPIMSEAGLVTGISVMSRNVTERIRNEEALVRARDEADSATRAKSGFLATMSHEIRTPLNGLLGMAELLQHTQLDNDQLLYLKSIRLSGEALLSVINDVLDFSRIESGRMELGSQPFEPERCIQETFGIIDYTAREKGIRLEYSIDPLLPAWVAGDKARLRQILVNLVGNAVKFTEKGTITVKVIRHRLESGADGFLFSVRDTGIGMTPDQVSKLFTAFTQGDAATFSKYGGSGLGLAISRSLVELMNGTIWAESAPGRGSVFYFSVYLPATSPPVVQDEVPARIAHATEAGTVPPLKILVAEDNEVNQQLIRLFLKKLGYDPDVVVSGKDAVDATFNTTYDLILMDIIMPDMDGIEAAKAILSRPGPKPVIIALTAKAMEGDQERCLAAGMKDYLTKPLRLEDLAAMVHKWGGTVPKVRSRSGKTSRSDQDSDLDQTVLARLKAVGGNDTEFVRNLVQLYISQSAETLGEIRAALNDGRIELAGAGAHKLKGSSLNLGVNRVAASCLEIEELVAKGMTEGLPGVLEQLEKHFQKALTTLKTIAGIT